MNFGKHEEISDTRLDVRLHSLDERRDMLTLGHKKVPGEGREVLQLYCRLVNHEEAEPQLFPILPTLRAKCYSYKLISFIIPCDSAVTWPISVLLLSNTISLIATFSKLKVSITNPLTV